MNFKTFIPLAVLAFAAPADAQQAGGNAPAGATRDGGGNVRVATANPSRIFNEMQETKDVQKNMEAEGVRLTSEEKEQKEAVVKLQSQRNQLRPNTPQWDDLNTKLMDAALEHRLWGEQTKAKAERVRKRQMKHLFQRIEEGIAEVAERDGYDLIVADQRPELPENLDQISFDQLRGLINTRNVLYASAKADISDTVIALLDAKYKAKGGASAGGPASAPRTAPAAGPRRAAPAPGAPAAGAGGAEAGSDAGTRESGAGSGK